MAVGQKDPVEPPEAGTAAQQLALRPFGTSTPEHLRWLERNFYDMSARDGLDLPLFDVSLFGPTDELTAEGDAALASLA
jgi:hypothetical protein